MADTYYQLFQLEHYGNILPPGSGMAAVDDEQRRLADREQTLIDIEVNNLDNE